MITETRTTCETDGCTKTFIQQTVNQKLCERCKRLRVLERQKARYHQVMGLVCRWCEETDKQRAFKTREVCNRCYTNGQRNGKCLPCEGFPMKKAKGVAKCPNCGLTSDSGNYLSVRLVCENESKVVACSRTSYVKCGGKKMTLAAVFRLLGTTELEMVVEEKAFSRGWVAQPTTILLPAGWLAPSYFTSWEDVRGLLKDKKLPTQMRGDYRTSAEKLITPSFLTDLYEFHHFANIGEAHPMQFGWWWEKFHRQSTKRAASRAWERLKKRCRESGVAYTLVDRTTGEPAEAYGGKRGTCAIRFDRSKLREFLQRHFARLDARKTA